MKDLSAVIFDLDGTLYDNKHLPIRLILADPANLFVLSTERKARKAIKGTDFQNAEGVYDALFKKMAEMKRSLSAEKARCWHEEKYMPLQVAVLAMYYTPRPCVDTLLENLRLQGKKTILYSDYGFAAEKLQALNIDPSLFDAVVSAPELGGLKPSRKSIERLLESAGLKPEECLMVGDRDDTDGASATSVGMEFYNVKTQGWDELLKILA